MILGVNIRIHYTGGGAGMIGCGTPGILQYLHPAEFL
jgi:hypothetical protein